MPYWSSAVTVTEPAVPAVEPERPVTVKCVAAADAATVCDRAFEVAVAKLGSPG